MPKNIKDFWSGLLYLAVGASAVIIAQDAAYCDMYFGDPAPSILQAPGARDVAVEFYSASKTYCMAGWRIGFMVGNPDLVAALAAWGLRYNGDALP